MHVVSNLIKIQNHSFQRKISNRYYLFTRNMIYSNLKNHWRVTYYYMHSKCISATSYLQLHNSVSRCEKSNHRSEYLPLVGLYIPICSEVSVLRSIYSSGELCGAFKFNHDIAFSYKNNNENLFSSRNQFVYRQNSK